MKGGFVILDFGSQYTQLIARRMRELEVYSEIVPFDISEEELAAKEPKGIVLSGGPSSVFDKEAPVRDVRKLSDIAPLLGICYGMQLIAEQFGGVVESSDKREYGFNKISWREPLSKAVGNEQKVWMSHGDIVKVPPPGFEVIALSESEHPAAIRGNNVWALQFHPEVTHTDQGTEILKTFIFDRCEAKNDWSAPNMLTHLQELIRERVPEGKTVLCALSGGVDSTVVGTLLTRTLGAENVHCVFVDNGLLRKNEFDEVMELYHSIGLNVKGVDASGAFLKRLAGVDDPEEKRKIIGHTFIDVFKREIKKTDGIEWLAQGTLYPDVIESVAPRGTSVTIKTHHNVGGLPENLNLNLVEPLRELFKDEVRAVGEELGIPKPVLWRHPFPGPGLAIRVLGAVTKEDLDTLRDADAIYIDELRKHELYMYIWQAFSVLLPVRTVGVQGDGRTYDKVLALRAVTSKDAMTADWFEFPPEFLKKVSNRITNEVKGINRVVYDVTSKPPGTIEWE